MEDGHLTHTNHCLLLIKTLQHSKTNGFNWAEFVPVRMLVRVCVCGEGGYWVGRCVCVHTKAMQIQAVPEASCWALHLSLSCVLFSQQLMWPNLRLSWMTCDRRRRQARGLHQPVGQGEWSSRKENADLIWRRLLVWADCGLSLRSSENGSAVCKRLQYNCVFFSEDKEDANCLKEFH